MAARERTYVCISSKLNKHILDELLQPYGWQYISLDDAAKARYVDLVFLPGPGGWNTKTQTFRCNLMPQSLRCNLKNWTHFPLVTNKVNLHILLTEKAPDLIAETQVVEAKRETPPSLPDEDVWIWRPEGGRSGIGVHIIDNQKSLDRVWEAFAKNVKRSRDSMSRALISRYVKEPLLFDGRKFDIRMYYIVVTDGTSRRAGLYREGKVKPATGVFDSDNYEDPKTYNVHTQAVGITDLRFPRDYPGEPEAAEKFFEKALNILTRVSELAIHDLQPRKECEAGFEILGCDFIVDRGGRVYLIEINRRPSLKTLDSSRDWLSQLIFEGAIEFAIEPSADSTYKRVVQCY